MKKKQRSIYGWIGGAAAMILIGGLSACKPQTSEGVVTTLAVQTPVMVRSAALVPVNRTVSVSGTITADKTSPLSFQVPGKVNRLFVDEGDHVKTGTLLATVDPADYTNGLDIAEATLARARDAYNRYEPLYREGAFTEKNLIELKTGLAQATAGRNIARKALADTRLYAPMPGIIGTKSIELGQMVSPQMAALTIVKTDVVFARVSVPETEIGQIAMGQNAEVVISALDGQRFTGRVSMIGAEADERTRTYAVKIRVPNPGGVLKPGMIARTEISTGKAVKVLTVPGHAIVRDADNLTYVFVADAGKGMAQRRRVIPGAPFRNEIEIRSGLTPDDAVIVSGQHKLADGSPITLSTTPPIHQPKRSPNESI
jgi:RND family efflux transporter MFP subunit